MKLTDIVLCEHTSEAEIVSAEEFMEAYVRGNLRGYNQSDIKTYADCYTLSSPSPKSNYDGVHKTLVLERGPFGTPSMNELLDIAIQTAFTLACDRFQKCIHETVNVLEDLRNNF